MYETGCVVSFKCADLEGTGSGCLVDTANGIVITHGTVASSLLTTKQIHLLSTNGILQNCFNSWNVEILLQDCEKQERPRKTSRYQTSALSSSEISLSNESKSIKEKSFVKQHASVISIFRLKKLEKVLSFLLPPGQWEYVEDFSKQKDLNSDEQSRFSTLTSSFIVLKINSWKNYHSDFHVLKYGDLSKGDNLELEATPFGALKPEIFFNSISRGIVSNKAGGVLLMTDARCIPGAEGGPVFCWRENQRYLIGIVIATLCWRSNEWVGLSMVCTLTDIINSVKHVIRYDHSYRHVNKVLRNGISSLTDSVPMIIVGSKWGSGVLVGQLDDSRSLLLTCSHVVRESGYNTVKVKFTDRPDTEKATVIYRTPTDRPDTEKATVIYRTPIDRPDTEKATVIYRTPIDKQFDIALLSIPFTTVRPIRMSSSPLSEGDQVYVIGHAIFGAEMNLQPTVTSGVVSKIISVNGSPVMIQTSCAVHAGASGGAVVDKYGYLVGIPTNNARDVESKASYPHVNMCVPIETVAPVIKKFVLTKDISILDNLYIQNEAIQRLWTLGDNIITASKL